MALRVIYGAKTSHADDHFISGEPDIFNNVQEYTCMLHYCCYCKDLAYKENHHQKRRQISLEPVFRKKENGRGSPLTLATLKTPQFPVVNSIDFEHLLWPSAMLCFLRLNGHDNTFRASHCKPQNYARILHIHLQKKAMSYISVSNRHIRAVLGINIEHRKETSVMFLVWHVQTLRNYQGLSSEGK
jgi:hypothetical protein